MLFNVVLTGMGAMFAGVVMMGRCRMGMMRGFFVVAGFVVLSGFGVVFGSLSVVFGGVLVAFCCFFRHGVEVGLNGTFDDARARYTKNLFGKTTCFRPLKPTFSEALTRHDFP